MVSPLGRGRRPEDAPAWLPALADALVEAPQPAVCSRPGQAMPGRATFRCWGRITA